MKKTDVIVVGSFVVKSSEFEELFSNKLVERFSS
jgi:hypothetical protein